MAKKYGKTVCTPLTEAEYARLKDEARRYGYAQQDYRRMLLLSDRSQLATARRENYWDEDTLEDIRADVRKLLRYQLHYGGMDGDVVLQILKRLGSLQASIRAGEVSWQSQR